MPRSPLVTLATLVGLLGLLLLLLLLPPTQAHGQAAPRAVDTAPDALRAWIPWVTRDVPGLPCPWVSGARTCDWPGVLALALDDDGATFTLDLRTDARTTVPLPGDLRHWPRDVRVDGATALVHTAQSRPALDLPAGRHRVTGRFAWSRAPDTLAVPPAIALVRVSRDGAPPTHPPRESDGTTRLREHERDLPADPTERQATVSLEVHRLLVDDIPIRLETRLRLRVSGDPRELDLGRVLPPAFTPTALDAPIPARLDGDGHLRVQLRPGDWTLTLHARTTDDLARFDPVSAPEPWPAVETWSLDSRPGRRAIEARGAPGVDPRQTSLPADWHALPAFQLTPEHPLELAVLTRGAAAPPAEQITVHRELRLTQDGTALIIRDTLSGERTRSRRLEAAAPSMLGRAALGDTDVLITRLDAAGNPGFEVRGDRFGATADLLHPSPTRLPAVGWNVDVQSLQATLHLPPGWLLVSAGGADDAGTAWLHAWGLLDLFLLLLIVLGLRAVRGTPTALLALLVLGIAWQTPHLPRLLWLLVVACTALATALHQRRGARIAEYVRRGALLLLAVAAVSFVWEESRMALFPQLAHGGAGPDGIARTAHHARFSLPVAMDAAQAPESALAEDAEPYAESLRARSAPSGARAEGRARSTFVDPSAIVQTGPGVPTWHWEAHPLRWSGPVSSEQELRLVLFPPWAVSLLRLFTVFGLLALLVLVLRGRQPAPGPRDDDSPPDPSGAPDTSAAEKRGGPSVAAGDGAAGTDARTGHEGDGPAGDVASTAPVVDVSEASAGEAPDASERDRGSEAGRESGVVSEAGEGDGPAEDPKPDAGVVSEAGEGEAPAEAPDAESAGKGSRGGTGGGGGAGGAAGLVLAVAVAAAMVGASAPAVASEGGGGLFPGTALLQELRAAAVAAPACGTDCVETASLTLDARDGVLTVRAEVHARAAGAWRVPGPESAWVPSEVRLDGAPAVALRRVGGGHLLLRVPEGVSRVELRGVLRDRVTLGFGEAPRVLVWEAEGWLLDGLRPDAAPPVSVHLTREVTETAPREEGGEEAEESRVELPPSLRLERRLEIGIPWMVHYRLVRQGGTAQAVRVRVPLLPGENLVTDGVSEEDGQVVVALEEGRDALEWSTTMTPVDTLVLEAASDVPWSESWTLVCSTLWHCRTDGLVPVALTGNVGGERVWSPTWLPWPGESVTLSFNRPGGVEGQTITVDRVDVGVTGGRRLRTTVATMTIRASRGGRWTLGVPAGAEVQRVSLDGRELPAMQEEGSVAITLPVGQSQVRVELREEVPGGMLWRGPSLELQGGASNVHVNWTVPEARWLLWTQGPRWGPVVTLWHWFPVLLILAFVLGRWAPTPLGTGSWLLLGLGMTQIFWLAPFLVVAWLVLLGVREKWQPESPDWHNVLQIGLGALTFAAFIVLVAAVVNGLALRPPDMQVVGGGSFGNQLRWYADRSDGALPGVALLTLPLWVWHVAMLAWALWLAGSLVRWVRWGWAAAGVGGMWRKSPPFEPVPPPVPPPGGGGAPPSGWGAPGRGVPPVPGPPFGGPPSGSGAPFGGPPSGSGAPFGGPPSGSGAPFGGPPSGSSAGGPAPASEGGYAGMGGGQRPGGSSAGGPAPASEAGPGGPSAGSGAPSVRPPSGAAPSAAAGPEAPGDDSPPDR